MKNFFTIFLFLLIILQFSCKKEKPQWDTQILTPLINTDLSIKNLDTLVFENSDSSVSLIYKYIFQKIDCSKFLHIPDTTLANTAALKTIKLGTREVEKKNTLGQIARENGAMGQIILNNHGSKMIIPQIPSSNVGNVNIDASGLFESIDVLDGVLIAKMHNGLPIEIRDVIYILKNKSSGARLLIDTIHSLMPNQDYTESYSLDGKTFEGKLVMEILNFSSPGTGIIPVLIDTNDALTIKVTIKIDELSSAIAIFPEQYLFDQQEDVEYHLNGQELVSMRLRQGTFKFIAISTIEDSCFIDYSIPGAKYLGTDPLQVNKVLPPAIEGDTVYIEETNNVSDYWFDLTGKNGNKVNSFYSDLKMRIDSTGKMIHLSLEDSIYLYYTLFDVVPEYVKGYLGQDSFSYSGMAKIDIFKNITKGKLGIEDVSFRFFTENGVGADAEILINKIEAKNNKTKLNKILSSTILNNPIVVQRATDNPFTPKYSYVELNNSNSNAKELIEILPDEFEYDIEVRFNPNGNTSNYNDFVYHDSKVNAGVEIELPLFISAEGLTMLDTLDFSLADAKSLDNIEKAMFRIIASNTFPFDASLQLYFVDKNNDILDSLFMADNRIMPGEIQEPGNKVMLAKITRIPEIVGASKMDNISYAEKIIIKAVFNTIPKDRKLKIYSDYKLNVKLVADFTYKTSF